MGKPRSRRDNNLILYGTLLLEDGIIVETVDGEGDLEYNLLDALEEFDGKMITLTVRENSTILPSNFDE